MKKFVTAFLAASALTASAAAPSFAGGLHQDQGFWFFGSGNVKVCQFLDVSVNAKGETIVKVQNTDNTSEWFTLHNGAGPDAVRDHAFFDALRDACDHADDNSKGPFWAKSYILFVTGTDAPVVLRSQTNGSSSTYLPAIFGGVVGNLPTTGTPNAGTNGFITEIKVKTNN